MSASTAILTARSLEDEEMFHGTKPGWIEVICGVMFSGKSEELIRRTRRAVIARKSVKAFKSHLDDRYEGVHTITTHDGISVDAIPVNSPSEIMELVGPDTQVVKRSGIRANHDLSCGNLCVASSPQLKPAGRAGRSVTAGRSGPS